jgi:dienelactone hydrolase
VVQLGDRALRRFAAVVLVIVVALLTVAAAPPAAQGKAKVYAVKSTELQLESRGTHIPATVVMPVGKAHERFPLVVIHHGHGGGRNENGGLTRVADALAKAGIMSIRMDFAGAGDSQEPFTKLMYTTMLADSNAALTYAVRNLPVDKDRIGGYGYSEGSAVVAMQAGQPFTPYKAVALMGPVAHPAEVFQLSMGEDQFWAYYAEAQANGYATVVTQWGQVQDTSLEWFDETLAADPVGDIEYFKGRALVLWGEAEATIPFGEVEAYMAATEDTAKSNQLVTIPGADHGYGFYSDQPEVDAVLHAALVDFFTKALR